MTTHPHPNHDSTIAPARPRRCGFTLIEVLTVVAIIGVLAAILIPVVGTVRASAAATRTASNLRQIGAGIKMFANEHGGYFPSELDASGNRRLVLTRTTIPGINGSTNWREAIHRYTTTQVRPKSGYNHLNGPDSEIWFSDNAERIGNNYHFGMNVFMGSFAATDASMLNLMQIPDPARYVIIGEINSPAHFIDPRVEPDYTGTIVTRNRMSQPGNTAFYLYADGHVEQLAGPRTPTDFPEMWYQRPDRQR